MSEVNSQATRTCAALIWKKSSRSCMYVAVLAWRSCVFHAVQCMRVIDMNLPWYHACIDASICLTAARYGHNRGYRGHRSRNELKPNVRASNPKKGKDCCESARYGSRFALLGGAIFFKVLSLFSRWTTCSPTR